MTTSTPAKPVLFSGMQPSADSLHLGNYVGALTNWIAMQEEYDAIYCVVNDHAITSQFSPEQLHERTLATAAQYIAAGIDPEKSTLYVQSDVLEHAQLGWILGTLTGFGEAGRMTQFKDKSQRYGADKTTVGLFTYPVLMAADILLFQAKKVPVGIDQKQHIELTRNLAERFNSRFGETFQVPEGFIPQATAKIYDLQEPTAKMSKSAATDAGLISVLDDPKVTKKRIMRAVTDADGEIRFDRDAKPGVSNLLAIYASLSGREIDAVVEEFAGSGYGDLKKALAEVVEGTFGPIRERTNELLADRGELERLLQQGADRARERAQQTLDLVYERIGFPVRKGQ
ncbi:tryptophan--tRNA ligase [Gulosibacter bifidus]|uniref:Tryptophan--tRNA ligase n=1 Tax=Gulosibacter bifidus TaxID=272239 RepID=A0ABW5RIH6_9MICO|nr:tryptophan--tRNA ligase [Gulosibacter bifidus]